MAGNAKQAYKMHTAGVVHEVIVVVFDGLEMQNSKAISGDYSMNSFAETLAFAIVSVVAAADRIMAKCPHLPGKSNATKVVKKGQKNPLEK